MIDLASVDTLFWFYTLISIVLSVTGVFAAITGWATHDSQPSAMALTSLSAAVVCGALAILQSDNAVIPDFVLVAVYRGAWLSCTFAIMFSVGLYVEAHRDKVEWLRRIMFWWEPLINWVGRDKGDC